MLDGDELAAFLAVADLQSFVQAADRLGVAQSVVSKRLHRLEDRLGARLFDRSNRRAIALTRFGELFIAEARETLRRVETAERVGRSLAAGETGPLRIGYVFSAAMTGLLTRLAAHVNAARPGLNIGCSLMETPEQIAALEQGVIDIALIRPRPSYPAGIEAHNVHGEGILLALAATHMLCGRNEVAVSDLRAETFIVPQFRETVGLIEHIRALARRGGFPELKTIQTPDYVSAASLAAAGLGVVLAPSSLNRLGLKGLSFLPIKDFSADFRLVLLRRGGMAPGLAELIDEALPPL